MTTYSESTGASLKDSRAKDRESDLHHLRIFAHPDATTDKPRWIVSHYHSEDDAKPTSHDFTDGAKMLNHIAQHASVPGGAHGPNDNLGRKILPTPADLSGANLTGRAR